MLRRLPLLLLLILCLVPVTALEAQGAPNQVNAALADLSRRLGQTITLDNVDDWRWAQDNYPDASLGCPQPGAAYAQVVTPGYKFLLTYDDITYDYRVSVDSQTVILCGQTSAEQDALATPTSVSADTIDSRIPCANPEPGVVYLPTRLTTNIQARVVPGPPNSQRSTPSGDGSFLGEIPGGAVINVVAGPQCAEGLVWWQVDYDGRAGWTVEGRDGVYWLESIPGVALPATRTPISAENADLVGELSRTDNNVIGVLAASPDGNTVAVLGGLGTDGVWLYNLSALDQAASLLRGTVQLESLDFNTDGTLMALGDVNGGVRVWDISPGAALLETAYFGAHQSDTSAVAFSPDGELVASVGSIANTLANVDHNNAILLWDLATVEQFGALGGHTARVNALDFSPDSAVLASGSGADGSATPDNSVRLWNRANGQKIAALEGHSAPVSDVEFSPDGTKLASASIDGTIILWDVATQAQTNVLQGTAATTLAFSPDGTLLAVAGGDVNAATPDYSISIWDVAAGELVATLAGHTGLVGSVDFTPDSSLIVSVGDDHSVRFWGVTASG